MSAPAPDLVYLGLGSNIQPEENLPRAVALLAERVPVVAVSSVWEAEAVGVEGPPFLNAALACRSPLSAEELKTHLLRPLERALGRIRTADKFAPRPIDLDILIHHGRLIDPDLWRLAYIAVPLAEILPNLRHPASGTRLAEVAARLRAQSDLRRRDDVRLTGM